jgi:putative glutamine amidotransferase
MKPIIGINLDLKIEATPERAVIYRTYYEAVTSSGGIPLLIPPMSDEDLDQVFTKIDGLMLMGGLDYCPSLYDEERHPTVQLIHPERQDFDLRLVQKALSKPDFPILGICGGLQILNIALDGSLVQDIPSEKPDSHVVHSKSANCTTEGWIKHEVVLEPGSRLHKIYNRDRVNVPTSHHQSVRKLGNGLKAAAHAEDGIIEAVEHQTRPFTFGVQWHPERDYETSKALFDYFIQQCRSVPVGAMPAPTASGRVS